MLPFVRSSWVVEEKKEGEGKGGRVRAAIVRDLLRKRKGGERGGGEKRGRKSERSLVGAGSSSRRNLYPRRQKEKGEGGKGGTDTSVGASERLPSRIAVMYSSK